MKSSPRIEVSSRGAKHYKIRGQSLKLRSIVLCHESLSRLLRDPIRKVKVGYLQRDLVRRAIEAAELRHPRWRRARWN